MAGMQAFFGPDGLLQEPLSQYSPADTAFHRVTSGTKAPDATCAPMAALQSTPGIA